MKTNLIKVAIMLSLSAIVICAFSLLTKSIEKNKSDNQSLKESIVIHDTIFVNKDGFDLGLGMALFKNGYMNGALHIIQKGTWVEEKWQRDSIAAYKYFK